MTADKQKLKEGLDAYCAQAKLTEMTRLCAYYFRRYHDTRRALIGCRLDKIDLEAMVESLTKQLGDKGLDITLGDNLDVK